jgi:hypothetical protein
MSDPTAVVEEHPPPQPPRPTQRDPQNKTQLSQLEADEIYARQLADHYSGAAAHEQQRGGQRNAGGRGAGNRRDAPLPRPPPGQGGSLKANELYDDTGRSFFDGK